VERLFEDVEKSLRGLDVLVNNAGIVHRAKFVDVQTESWRTVMETNLTACFVLAREAARHMSGRGGGRIINVGSVMSAIARWGAPAYVTSKHGLIGLTRAIAVEFGRKGVTCNAIAPGFIRTELNVSQQQHPKTNEQVISRTPLARWGEPGELAGAVVFLASDASSYVNGLTLFVDGGLTAAF
jgi:gluconate 5-dehydrogenase